VLVAAGLVVHVLVHGVHFRGRHFAVLVRVHGLEHLLRARRVLGGADLPVAVGIHHRHLVVAVLVAGQRERRQAAACERAERGRVNLACRKDRHGETPVYPHE
jgi:hypothetical protein